MGVGTAQQQRNCDFSVTRQTGYELNEALALVRPFAGRKLVVRTPGGFTKVWTLRISDVSTSAYKVGLLTNSNLARAEFTVFCNGHVSLDFWDSRLNSHSPTLTLLKCVPALKELRRQQQPSDFSIGRQSWYELGEAIASFRASQGRRLVAQLPCGSTKVSAHRLSDAATSSYRIGILTNANLKRADFTVCCTGQVILDYWDACLHEGLSPSMTLHKCIHGLKELSLMQKEIDSWASLEGPAFDRKAASRIGVRKRTDNNRIEPRLAPGSF